MTCEVTVTQGVLRGKISESYSGRKFYSYEGIPYAKPPVGELRFRDPLPPEKWSGILDATKPGNKCAQYNIRTSAVEGSEDCLYLNVYVPVLPKKDIKKIPVVVFIHGGRYIFGYGDYYRPDYFLDKDVVFVSFNYRLSILGFLCLDTPEVPGNAGLKDTVMALRWVKNNIGFFNGDPNNVTVMGESAGSASANCLLVSKTADGLYQKLICESGNCISDLFLVERDPLEHPKMIAQLMGQNLNTKKELYDYFLNVNVVELTEVVVTCEIMKKELHGLFLPVPEKRFDNVEPFMTELPYVSISENRFNKVPILNGSMTQDGALFIQKVDNEYEIKAIEHYTPKYLKIDKDSARERGFVNKIKDFYFKNGKIGDPLSDYVTFVSDVYFSVDTFRFNELISKYHDNIYVFEFNYSGNMSTRVMKNLGVDGAAHGDILQYQFYKKNKHDVASENDIAIVNFLRDTLYSFIKDGKPTCSKPNIVWPRYDKDKFVLSISKKIKVIQNPFEDKEKIWNSIFKESSKL